MNQNLRPPLTDTASDLRHYEPISPLLRAVIVVTAVGCGAMGGVFFAFSAFVMPALKRLPAAQGASAMQSINITAVRPPLMIALFGTAALCVGLTVRAGLTWGNRRAWLLVLGGALYLVGTVGLTAAFHVPLNDSLATVDPTSAGGAHEWADYLTRWTAGNHVRAFSSLAAAAVYILALTAES